MQANQNFYHNNVMYRTGQNVDIKDMAEVKILKDKGIIVDKYEKPKAKVKAKSE